MSFKLNEMKKTPIYIQILEFLELHGTGNQVNIAEFMLSIFGNLETEGQNHQKFIEVNSILSDLVKRKLIDLDNNLFQLYISGMPKQKTKWFDNAEFNSILTTTGLEYLGQYRLIQSNLELNEASKRNAEIQKKHSIITIIVAAAAVLCAFIGLFKS